MCTAVGALSSPKTQALAAASLVEAGTSGEGQDTEAGGEKKKKTRRKKDPAAPKKALTGYLVYINSKREQIIRENPDADLKDQVCGCVCAPMCVYMSLCLLLWSATANLPPLAPL